MRNRRGDCLLPPMFVRRHRRLEADAAAGAAIVSGRCGYSLGMLPSLAHQPSPTRPSLARGWLTWTSLMRPSRRKCIHRRRCDLLKRPDLLF